MALGWDVGRLEWCCCCCLRGLHKTSFDLFGMYVLNMLSLTIALLGVHLDLILWIYAIGFV